MVGGDQPQPRLAEQLLVEAQHGDRVRWGRKIRLPRKGGRTGIRDAAKAGIVNPHAGCPGPAAADHVRRGAPVEDAGAGEDKR